jgi:hypothetical protein
MLLRAFTSTFSPVLRNNNQCFLRPNPIRFAFASEPESSDPDFQKQTKVELTNENAQKIIEKWVT